MSNKIREYYLKIISFIILFFSLINSVDAMDFKEPYELPREILDKYQEINPNDPPFFKLTLNNKKIIYILGSIHPINPQIILSNRVFEKILEIAPHATLCSEHPSPFNHLLGKLRELTKDNKIIPNQWDMESLLKDEDKENWDKIKDHKITDEYTFKISDIQKLPIAEGVMLFKTIISKKYKKFIPGFEATLRQFPWKNKGTIYLESVQESIRIIADYHNDLSDFFLQSFRNLKKRILEESNQKLKETESIASHKAANRSYGHKFLLMSKEIKPSTVERNKIWAHNVVSYLKGPSSADILFIVCGNAHLKGSFLMELLNQIEGTGLLSIENLKRMDNNGEWID